MNTSQCVGYGFGAIITILLIAAIFSFNYHSEIEQEYFTNYLKLDQELRSIYKN